ncbi:MAG: hypothetical protein EBV65_10870, partial [Gammaproteobacteria bacterium]|nr:hypothetical protein [Gammaproteobacteria bacterium]
MKIQDIVVPDLGSFADVPVIDVLVAVGDVVEAETPLVTLETDKASMDVPAPHGGTVSEILVRKGSKVSKGSVIVRLAVDDAVVPTTAAAAPSGAAA